MKILITTFTYPPNADGCAQAASVRAQGLAGLGHDVTVATESHPGRTPDSSPANPRVVEFKISGWANLKYPVKGDSKAFEDFLRESSFDVMIFENWDAWPTRLAEPLLPLLKAKKILVSHGYTPQIWVPYPKFPWGLGYWMGGWPLVLRTPLLLRRIDHFVFLSTRTDFGRFFDHRLARFLARGRYSIIPNGAFAREFKSDRLPDFRKEFGVAGPMLLSVANYCERKNQNMAVRAFRQARLENATLVLIGSEFNEYAEGTRRLDAELQKEFPAGRVLFLEKLTRAQTCAAYFAADLFVLSATAETLPIVLLEAMASHTPWISTDTGCVSELPGGIIARGEKEMALKMRELMTQPEPRGKLAEDGWAACQKTYDWEKTVEAYDRLIKQVCAGREIGN